MIRSRFSRRHPPGGQFANSRMQDHANEHAEVRGKLRRLCKRPKTRRGFCARWLKTREFATRLLRLQMDVLRAVARMIRVATVSCIITLPVAETSNIRIPALATTIQ
jgi:hypothetical protein